MTRAVMPSPATPCLHSCGDPGVRRLTRRLYALMDVLPQVIARRAIQPRGLGHGEQKLLGFLSGWPGGPPLFEQRHGVPLLCCRHPGLPMAAAEAEGWLACFRPTPEETVADAGLRAFILPRVEAPGEPMRNRAVA